MSLSLLGKHIWLGRKFLRNAFMLYESNGMTNILYTRQDWDDRLGGSGATESKVVVSQSDGYVTYVSLHLDANTLIVDQRHI